MKGRMPYDEPGGFTLISLKIRPILKTLRTLSRVGDMGKFGMKSSMMMPVIDVRTRTKSNKFQARLK